MYIVFIIFALACITGSVFAGSLFLLLPLAVIFAVVYFFKRFSHSVKIFKRLHYDSSESIHIPGYENKPIGWASNKYPDLSNSGECASAFTPTPEPAKEETKVESKPDEAPQKEVVEFHLPDTIDGATVAYQYEEVAFVLDCAEDPDPYMAKELCFEKNADKILVKHENVQIGRLKSGKISEMISDWLSRGDPIRAFLTGYNSDESTGHFIIVFYRDAIKHAKRRGAATKEYKLVGNKSEAVQDECYLASVGDRCSIEYDNEKEKYEVRDDMYNLYGYLPVAGAKFYEDHDGDCLVEVSNVELDDDHRTVIYISLIAK